MLDNLVCSNPTPGQLRLYFVPLIMNLASWGAIVTATALLIHLINRKRKASQNKPSHRTAESRADAASIGR
jgi:hypothetical protein